MTAVNHKITIGRTRESIWSFLPKVRQGLFRKGRRVLTRPGFRRKCFPHSPSRPFSWVDSSSASPRPRASDTGFKDIRDTCSPEPGMHMAAESPRLGPDAPGWARRLLNISGNISRLPGEVGIRERRLSGLKPGECLYQIRCMFWAVPLLLDLFYIPCSLVSLSTVITL